MSMPPQLANARRPKRSEPKPLAELLPKININSLAIPRDHQTYIDSWISFRYPFLSSARLNARFVELHHSGRIQTFRLKWIRTGLGWPRPSFICQCGRAAIKLYLRRNNLSCRFCAGLTYASRQCSKRQRPILQSIRAKAFLDAGVGLRHATQRRLQRMVRQLTGLNSTRITGKALLPQSKYSIHTYARWD